MMKIVILLILLLVSTSLGDVQCGENRFCRVGFRPFQSANLPNDYQRLRNAAHKLISYAENKIVGILGSELEHLDLARHIDELCQDDTVGFVLDRNVSDYRVSCIWTGASQFGQCRAVPAEYGRLPYYYVDGTEWAERLRKVRKALGCNAFFTLDYPSRSFRKNFKAKNLTTTPKPTNYSNPRGGSAHHNYSNPMSLKYDTELFICNERCVQGGIGYAASVLIIATLAISFFKNCVELE